MAELEYCVSVDFRVIGFTHLKSRNPVCSAEFGCLFHHIDGLRAHSSKSASTSSMLVGKLVGLLLELLRFRGYVSLF